MNLLYLNTHDTGRAISPYGIDAPTPTFKELAEDGTLFTHAYCCSPTCSPSRAAMLTGTYPHQNGMLGLAQRGFSLSDPSKHLANFLKSQNYQTVISGIQHESGWYLDENADGIHQLGYDEILTVNSNQYKKDEYHLWDRENALKMVDWLKNHDRSKPFMASYGMHSTHRIYPSEIIDEIDPRYVKPISPCDNNEDNRKDHAQFLTSAYYADQNIKLIIQALKDTNLYDETIIIYTTDHGVAIPFHKCNLTDSGIGVSLIIRNPKVKSKGIVVDQLISQVDVFPTLCDLLGLEKPNYLEGKSFKEIFENKDAKINDVVFAEVNFHTSYEPMRCVRNNRYKYIKYYDEEWNHFNLSNMDESIPKAFLMKNDLISKDKDLECLYDCYYDPEERDNLINKSEYKDIIDSLRNEMIQIQIKTNDPILNGNIPVKSKYKVNKVSCIQASSKNSDDYVSLGVKD
ncbi:sulfatase family protein [Anaerorhabdus sp.]|uniref:sulfatase family protein n=1 Tax=Anaerorhabdus sp. TaxID=1872524 RepID=UPI002FCC5974